jgi:TRAP-type C4-dicarboxylate transport system permease small subunit
MQAAVRWVDHVLRAFIVVVVAVLVVCVVWQVTSRFLLGAPSTVTDELARFAFIWSALFGAAYTLGQRRHLAINLFAAVENAAVTRPLDLIRTALIAAFAGGVMIYGGTDLALATLRSGQVSPAMRLPMGWIYMAIPVSGALILFYCAAILRDIFGPDARGPCTPVEEEH